MVVKTIFNELYQALNMKKIMKKNPFNFHVHFLYHLYNSILNRKNSLIEKWHKLVNKSIQRERNSRFMII